LKLFKNFWSILLEGTLFLLPIVIIVYLLKFVKDFISPISNILPEGGIFGLGMKNIASIIILLTLLVAAGIMSRSGFGRIYNDIVESIFSKIVPGFSVIKKLMNVKGDSYEDKKIKAALAYIDDAWLFAFILEEKNDAGLLTVFVPSAPIPTSGNVYLMREEQVKRLDIKTSEVVKCITQLGIGSGKILEGKIK